MISATLFPKSVSAIRRHSNPHPKILKTEKLFEKLPIFSSSSTVHSHKELECQGITHQFWEDEVKKNRKFMNAAGVHVALCGAW